MLFTITVILILCSCMVVSSVSLSLWWIKVVLVVSYMVELNGFLFTLFYSGSILFNSI